MEYGNNIQEIKSYMNRVIDNMGNVFSHFTITIWTNGYSTENGMGIETAYDLMLIPEHNIPYDKLIEYLRSGKCKRQESMIVERFSMYKDGEYEPGKAFKEAQKAGRKLYFDLRKEYLVHRDLGYK